MLQIPLVFQEKDYICLVNRTGNNLFMRILLQENGKIIRLLKQLSVGQVGFKGPRKRTSYSGEIVGKNIGEYLRLNNINEITLYLCGKKKKFHYFKYAIRALIKSEINIKKVKFFLIKAHNGVRLRKSKRR
jgi:ribosomal protein S11